MKKLTTLLSLLLVGSSALAVQMNYQLMQSKYADPTRMQVEWLKYPKIIPFDTSIGNVSNCNAWTSMVWLKQINPSLWVGEMIRNANVTTIFSVRSGLSNKEGRKDIYLTNLCSWDYDTPLTLDSNGQWGATSILKAAADYDRGGNDDVFKYGVYTVNIQTDTDLTLTVGSAEKTVTASDEMQIFDIEPTADDRSVSIAAASADAVVKLGICENPAVEFLGGNGSLRNITSTSGARADRYQGVNDTEWFCYVLRAKINDDKTVTYQYGALYDNEDVWEAETTETPKWTAPNAYFQPYARIQTMCFWLGLAAITNDAARLGSYGGKLFNGWLDDDFISMVRDQDVTEMKRRGYSFPKTNPDYFTIGLDIGKTSETQTATASMTEAGSGAVGTKTIYNTTYNFNGNVTITPGSANIHEYKTSDYSIKGGLYDVKTDTDIAAGSIQIGSDLVFDGTKTTFPSTGTYGIMVTDPNGNSQMDTFQVYGATNMTTYTAAYTSDTANSLQAKANASVYNALMNATCSSEIYSGNSGAFTYRKYFARRNPCNPVSSTAGGGSGAGNCAMAVLSPHTYVSATHYWWRVPGTETFVSEDNSVTSVVKTATTMVKLSDWALEHGFTQDEVTAANCGDIMVGTFAEGTVADACTPYFLTPSVCSNSFGKAGVLGWSATQLHMGWMYPIVFTPKTGTEGNYDWFGSWSTMSNINSWKSTASFSDEANVSFYGLVNSTYLSAIQNKGTELSSDGWMMPQIFGGDSALGVYLEIDGKFVMVSHYKYVGGGNSYVRAWKLLKAYIEAAGDTFKTIE